jgi:hypothetical protein
MAVLTGPSLSVRAWPAISVLPTTRMSPATVSEGMVRGRSETRGTPELTSKLQASASISPGTPEELGAATKAQFATCGEPLRRNGNSSE